MLNRHGLIAGATGTGKTKTLQLLAGQLSKAGVPVFVADIKGDVTGIAAPGDATQPEGRRARRVARLDVRAVRPSGRVPVAVGQARRPGPGDGPLVRAAAARQGPRPQRDPDLDPVAHLQVLRRQRPAAARPEGPRGDAQVPRVGRGQADPRRLRRDVARIGRGAPPLDRRPRAGRRRHLLRRAGVRRRRPPPDDARRAGIISVLELSRRHGQAAPVQHVHALDARPAVRDACPRSATCRSRSSASSSTRRTCCSTAPPRRSSTRSSGRPG